MSKYGDLIKQAREPESLPRDSKAQESSKTDSGKQDVSKQDSIRQETRKQDSYSKVAMRLSTEAAQKLKDWRYMTGLPYEILVDVLIRNTTEIPEPYLDQAREIRQQRLLEGKEKALERAKNAIGGD